jgi:8-oxo-dGTP diphosphatase
VKRKVYAYITHGGRLLVFSHIDFPEAGIQVPGGTVEDDEEPEDAVMREAAEETGLTGLRRDVLLAEVEVWIPLLQEWQRRTFYHLTCMGNPPERWYHSEVFPSDGSPGPIRFEFFWAPLSGGVPALIGGLGALLPKLITVLNLSVC